MNEVLMLDIGGNSGYAAGLTSPKEAANFSFHERSSSATSADPSDASWHVSEVEFLEQLLSQAVAVLCACYTGHEAVKPFRTL